MDERTEVWYFDECSVNCWDTASKVWMDKKQPYILHVSRDRGSGLTILGRLLHNSLIYLPLL